MTNEAPISVVTAFVTRGGRVLLLKRSSQVGTYSGLWAGVSGYLETDSAVEQAMMEIGEELDVASDGAVLEIEGEPLEVLDEKNQKRWTVHPYRFVLRDGVEPRIDWEHVEMRWVEPDEIRSMKTVPSLWEAWLRVSTGFGRR